MIKLKRFNVVKFTESEFRAQQLERQGFRRVTEEPKKQSRKKAETKNEGGE